MGAILFVSGLVAAVTGSTVNTVQRAKGIAREEELSNGNFSLSTQVHYDCHPAIDAEYDALKIAEAIKQDWPGIQLPEAVKVAHMAIAKNIMERETTYNYYVQDEYKMFDLDKYIKDKYKHDVFEFKIE